jgi:hypothetical protein
MSNTKHETKQNASHTAEAAALADAILKAAGSSLQHYSMTKTRNATRATSIASRPSTTADFGNCPNSGTKATSDPVRPARREHRHASLLSSEQFRIKGGGSREERRAQSRIGVALLATDDGYPAARKVGCSYLSGETVAAMGNHSPNRSCLSPFPDDGCV